MKLNGQYLEQRFALAAQQELASGSADELFTEITSKLDRDTISEGFGLYFKEDRAAFASVIGALGIEELLHRDESSHHIHTAMAIEGSITGFIGKAMPALSRLALVDALDVLQADFWQQASIGNYPRFSHGDDVTFSQLLITATVPGSEDKHGFRTTDITHPGLVIGARYRYTPQILTGGHAEDSISYFIRDNTELHADPSELVIALADELASDDDQELAMPSGEYYIEFGGTFDRVYIGNLSGVNPSWDNRYDVVNGRLEPRILFAEDEE